jgi:hypothetical protein
MAAVGINNRHTHVQRVYGVAQTTTTTAAAMGINHRHMHGQQWTVIGNDDG